MEKLFTKSSVIVNGKIVPPGKTIECRPEDVKSLVDKGAAVKAKEENKSNEDEARQKAKAEAEAKKKADAKAKEQEDGKALYTEEEFRALSWDKAREVAGKLYGVKDNSRDGLTREFMAAQEKAFSGSGGK